MIRGLNLFRSDGMLREPATQSEPRVNDSAKKPHIPQGGGPMAPNSKNKIPFYSGKQAPERKKKTK
jgi:hypothetical protein